MYELRVTAESDNDDKDDGMTKKTENGVAKKKSVPDEAPVLHGYEGFLQSLKDQIEKAQVRAAVSINAQLIELYYSIGKAIVDRQEQAGWGDAVLERLSKDLIIAFPEMKGLSQRNL